MIILDDDNHTRLTIWHLNQFIDACTQRYICIYLYVQRYLSKIPFLVKYLKCLCLSQQARVEFWGLGRCQTRPHHQLLATVLWVSQHWELEALRAMQKDKIAGYSPLWPKRVWGASVKTTDNKVVRLLVLVISQSVPWLWSEAKILLRGQITNIVPLRLTFRQKKHSKAICWKTGAH